jgi:hypothetical protein
MDLVPNSGDFRCSFINHSALRVQPAFVTVTKSAPRACVFAGVYRNCRAIHLAPNFALGAANEAKTPPFVCASRVGDDSPAPAAGTNNNYPAQLAQLFLLAMRLAIV